MENRWLKYAFLIGLFCGCATGERFTSIEEGMTKEYVRKVMGKQDQIEKRDGGWTIYYYKHRLMSGWSWDQTDYYVVFDPNDKVYVYGHGEVDSRLSERMMQWSLEQQRIQAESQKKAGINCVSTGVGNSVMTNCQ